MLINEAIWIGNVLSGLPADVISPCLNLGSSTKEFRTAIQPYIEEYIIGPNEARGIRFIHADIKEAPGVDMAGDIYDPIFQQSLAARSAGGILCCNMFEHVRDRRKLADICVELVRPAGYIIVTVPRSFPYHPDPIDTYFRPNPADIVSLFRGCEIIRSDLILEQTYWNDLLKLTRRDRYAALMKILLHCFIPFYKWDRWKERLHPLLWLFRRYSVTAVVLKAPST
jgi:SAM-dependent methyltransferase